MAENLEPINWHDDYYRSVDRIVLTSKNLSIPGIRTFGWHDMKRAVPALKPHFHENCFEITFVTKGSMSFFVNQREYTINGGDAFFTFPNEVHSTNGIPMSVGEIFWIQLDISHPENFLYLTEDAANSLIAMLQNVTHHCFCTDTNKCGNAVMELKEVLLNTPSRNPFLIASFVVVFLYQLLACTDESNTRVSLDMAQACEYIQEHICEELPLREIADFCNVSESHFKQKFKAQLGISPRSYINKQKIMRICNELRKDSNLTQIANEYSFCNSSYFSTVFKKYMNQTPTEYIMALSEKN